jgi:hypothetical protein
LKINGIQIELKINGIQIDVISIEILLGVEKRFVKGHKFEITRFHSSLLRNWLYKFEF